MPYRRFRRPRPKRPIFGRRRFKRKRVTNLWPKARLVKFSVVHRTALAPTVGTCGVVAYKANSLNDPFQAQGAGLPIGLDQWASMYSKYKVVKSTMTAVTHPTTITGAAVVGIHLANNATLLTDCDHYRELPYTTSRVISPDIDISKNSMTYRAKSFYSLRNLKDADELEGSFSTSPGDPSKTSSFHYFYQDHNSTDALTVEVSFRITYTVLLYERIMPARSSL